MLICDWLLETRTSCWEMKQNVKVCADDDNNNFVLSKPLPSKELEQFQSDLNSLYCIIDQIPVRFLICFFFIEKKKRKTFSIKIMLNFRRQNLESTCMKHCPD